jgi:hypothetical protein
MGNMAADRTMFGVAASGILSLALTVFGSGTAAASDGGLVNGEYDCGGGYTYRAMGKVDIRSGQFRFRPYGDVVGGFAPYSIGSSGAIQWGGPFSGLDDPPGRIVASTRETWGFNVKYLVSPGGSINMMSCHAPGK